MNPDWTPPPGWGNSMVDGLVEVPVIEQVSLFPTTAAWVWVLGLVGLLVVLMLVRAIVTWRRNRYRREALAELEKLRTATDLGRLPVLLKATALQAYGRSATASLFGQEWLDFLTSKAPAAAFNGPVGEALLEIDYHPREQWQNATDQNEALFNACSTWIKQHPLPKPNSATKSHRGQVVEKVQRSSLFTT